MKNLNKFTHSIMFHHFHNEIHPKGQGAISSYEFEKIIDWLTLNYTLNDADDYLKKALENNLKSSDICLSFDDALLCQYDVAVPILSKRNIKAFFFVYSSPFLGNPDYLEIFRYFRTVAFDSIDEFYEDFLLEFKNTYNNFDLNIKNFEPKEYLKEFPFYSYNDKLFRYLRDEILKPNNYKSLMMKIIKKRKFDIKNASKNLWFSNNHLINLEKMGHLIGLHSNSHPMQMNSLHPNKQLDEYKKNFSHLSKVLNQEIISMSHPCGNYNEDTLMILKKLGIKIGFRSNSSFQEIVSSLEIPREDHSNILEIIS